MENKDLIGNKLSVGDEVVLKPPYIAHITTGKIKSMTERTAEVEYIHPYSETKKTGTFRLVLMVKAIRE